VIDKPVWDKPNDFYCVFRCTTIEFAIQLMEFGRIKFNTPTSWVEYAMKFGDGRGDLYEGTVAFCHLLDIDRVIELNKKYNGECFSKTILGNRLFFKSRFSMGLPCYCFYILKIDKFECPGKVGIQKIETDIEATYFRDFADNKTPREVDQLSENERPALVCINDYPEFIKRIKQELIKLGLDENEIITTGVSYFDFEKYGDDGWIDFNQREPNELSIKSTRFANQSEARIILNTKKKDILVFLQKNTIEIGSIQDIAQYTDTYLYEGIHLEMNVKIFKKGQ